MEMICGYSKVAPGAVVIGIIIHSVDKRKTSYEKYVCSFVVLCYTLMDFP